MKQRVYCRIPYIVSFLFFLPACLLTREPSSERFPQGSVLHIVMNANGGELLMLSDESYWEVAPEDRGKARLWLSPSPLKISRKGHDEYDYILTDLLSSQTIRARPHAPFIEGSR